MKATDLRIHVMTTDREVPTLDISLRSLQQSLRGLGSVRVMEDVPKIGCFKHYDRCLKAALKTKAKYVAVFPDDMLYSRPWVSTVIEKLEDKSVGYCALFLPQGLGRRLHFAKGWNQTHGGWATSWGGCYVFRADVARKIVKHPFYINHLNNYQANKQIDHCIPEVVHQLGLKQYWLAPSVCEHIGMASTIGHMHTIHEQPFRP